MSFDYAKWVDVARDFSRQLSEVFDLEFEISIAPKLSCSEIKQLQRLVGKPIPVTLREFFEQGCGGLEVSYAWEPDVEDEKAIQNLRKIYDGAKAEVWGGGPFCYASRLQELELSLQHWARETWVASDPQEFSKWTSAIPLMELPNGDFLGLDGRQVLDDPPVLYLAHDDVSHAVDESFTLFLEHWSQILYIGPEYWMLRPFLSEKGFLDPSGENAKLLRATILESP